MKVHIVFSTEDMEYPFRFSIDSVHFNEGKANTRMDEIFKGGDGAKCEEWEVE